MTRTALRYLITVALTAAAPACRAQMEVGGKGLTATAEITEQKYCLGEPFGGSFLENLPPDAITLQLTTRVSFRNVSARPIIYLASSDEEIVLSNSLDDAERRRNQTLMRLRNPQPHSVLRDPADLESDQPRTPPFVVLPAASNGLPWEYSVILQVHDPAAPGPVSELLGKTVFLQLDLSFALIPSQIVPGLEARWRPYGTLWARRIRTQPIKIDIPRSPKVSKCQSELKID